MWRIILTAKALVLIISLIGIFGFDPGVPVIPSCPHWPDPIVTGTSPSRLANWDGAFYLRLSEHGYQRQDKACAFYPLWPWIIRWTTALTFGNPLVAALILSNTLSVLAFWLFYTLVKNKWGELSAKDALILLLAFPGAFFFSIPYTESLFMVLVLGFFFMLEQNRLLAASFFSFLLPLARPVGVFTIAPFLWHLYERRKPARAWVVLVFPFLGYAAYFWVMHVTTGNALEGFEAQQNFPNSQSLKHLIDWHGFFAAFTRISSLDGMKDALLDRVVFALFLVLLPLVYRLDKTWFIYVLPIGLIPAMTNMFMSYRRYIVVCFPLFLVIAQLLQKLESRMVFWYVVACLACLQAWGVIQFLNFGWAG